GRPHLFHPDEARVSYAVGDIDRQVESLNARLRRGEAVTLRERVMAYNPHFFAYGSLPFYLMRSSRDLCSWARPGINRVLHATGLRRLSLPPPDLFVVGRGWSAFFDTLTILMVFLIGSRLFSRAAGALAALFFAFTVFHIQLAHFLTVDVTVSAVVVLTFYFCARLMQGGRGRHYALAGLFAGLALATKFSAAPLLLLLLVAHLGFCRSEGRLFDARQWGKLLCALAVLAIVFTLCEPFFFLDHADFMRQLKEQKDMVQGRWVPPWAYQYEHTVKGLYQLKNLFAYGMGPPLAITLGCGIAVFLMRRWRHPSRELILLLAWVIPVTAATVSFRVKFMRYFAPLIPFFCIMGAEGLCLIHRQSRGRWARWGVAALAVVAVAYSAMYSLAYVGIYRRDDTRVQASNWIYQNIPKRARILNETWEFVGVPTGTSRGDPGSLGYTIAAVDIYRSDDRGKARYLAEELAKGDVIALATKRMYGSVLRVADRYPVTSNYFRLLFQERLGYRLVKTITSYPELFGVSLNDDYADESFTVYDHPKVVIFKKAVNYPADYLQKLIAAEPKIDCWPVLADILGADEFNRPERCGGDITPALEGYTPRGYGSARALIVWLIMIELMGVLALPLTALILGGLSDRGYPFAKTVAVALAGYLVWIAASLGIAPFSRMTIGACLLLLALCSWLLPGARGALAFFRARRGTVLFSEAVFLGSFGIFLVFRLFNPDVFWSESSMDFSFINSILRSRAFPPIDPWASGVYLNYYYYGHYLVAMLTKLSGIPSHISYNLAFCLIPALVISGICSIAITVTGGRGYGLLAGFFAGLLGNLDGFFLLIDGYRWRAAFYKLLHLTINSHSEGSYRFFRCAHEVIRNTVHEFPFWSFIFVDLHAHVVAMPFAVLFLAIALNCVISPRHGIRSFGSGAQGVAGFLTAAIVLGMMVPMNTWDFPTYTMLLGVLLLVREFVRHGHGERLPLSAHSIWWSCGPGGKLLLAVLSLLRLEGPIGRPIRMLSRVLCAVGPLAAVALIAYAPFFQ
ncbi:MAG: DUF2298 domain-containing protein, partial [Candidatus Aureabacteria bacterium]|nr:DUF2298 domain-containing protein [Candidatus Auribacterota bacterium]